jgi:hypothetical protein
MTRPGITLPIIHSAVMIVSAQESTDMFRYRRAAFYSGLKSKVGLIAAKTAALRVNMNTDGCLLCLPRCIPFSPHLACAFPPHLIPLPQCAPTLHAPVREVDTIPYKPWPSTSLSHSHSFSPRTHGFRSTTIPAVINNISYTRRPKLENPGSRCLSPLSTIS